MRTWGDAFAKGALERRTSYSSAACPDSDGIDRTISHESPRQAPRNVENAGDIRNA
jgi:hypothetical protein